MPRIHSSSCKIDRPSPSVTLQGLLHIIPSAPQPAWGKYFAIVACFDTIWAKLRMAWGFRGLGLVQRNIATPPPARSPANQGFLPLVILPLRYARSSASVPYLTHLLPPWTFFVWTAPPGVLGCLGCGDGETDLLQCGLLVSGRKDGSLCFSSRTCCRSAAACWSAMA